MSELDHPCKQTCSGWRQGYERGVEEHHLETEAIFSRLRQEIRSLMVVRAEALKMLARVASQPTKAKQLHKQADRLRLAIEKADAEVRSLDEYE